MEQIEVHQTPTVEQYARMQQHERDKAAQIHTLNKRLRAARAKTLEAKIFAVEAARARTIYNARADARKEAAEEVAFIFQDEYTRERVRAFEAFPTRPKTYGDIEACAAEAYEYDKRHRTNP